METPLASRLAVPRQVASDTGEINWLGFSGGNIK